MKKKCFWILFLVLSIGILKHKGKNYTINITKSLPVGIYRLEKVQKIKVGDIVEFQLEEEEMNFLKERGYLPDIAGSLLKIVAADKTNADKIAIKQTEVFPLLYIEDKNWGPILSKDSNNRTIPQISLEEMKPKDGEYLLLSPVFRSYDGRYWGVIKKENILNKVTPVFTLSN